LGRKELVVKIFAEKLVGFIPLDYLSTSARATKRLISIRQINKVREPAAKLVTIPVYLSGPH